MADIEQCFLCCYPSDITHAIYSTRAPYSLTPYAQCITQLLGEDYVFVLNMEEMICNCCCSLLDQRDKLKEDLKVLEDTLIELLQLKLRSLEDGVTPSSTSSETETLTQPITDPLRETPPPITDPVIEPLPITNPVIKPRPITDLVTKPRPITNPVIKPRLITDLVTEPRPITDLGCQNEPIIIKEFHSQAKQFQSLKKSRKQNIRSQRITFILSKNRPILQKNADETSRQNCEKIQTQIGSASSDQPYLNKSDIITASETETSTQPITYPVPETQTITNRGLQNEPIIIEEFHSKAKQPQSQKKSRKQNIRPQRDIKILRKNKPILKKNADEIRSDNCEKIQTQIGSASYNQPYLNKSDIITASETETSTQPITDPVPETQPITDPGHQDEPIIIEEFHSKAKKSQSQEKCKKQRPQRVIKILRKNRPIIKKTADEISGENCEKIQTQIGSTNASSNEPIHIEPYLNKSDIIILDDDATSTIETSSHLNQQSKPTTTKQSAQSTLKVRRKQQICKRTVDDTVKVTVSRRGYKLRKRNATPVKDPIIEAIICRKAGKILSNKRPLAPRTADTPPNKHVTESEPEVGQTSAVPIIIYQCKICQFNSRSLELLNKHKCGLIKTTPLRGRYNCKQCEFRGDSYIQLAKHLEEEHLQETIPCDLCSMSFPDCKKLVLHKKNHVNFQQILPKPNFVIVSEKSTSDEETTGDKLWKPIGNVTLSSSDPNKNITDIPSTSNTLEIRSNPKAIFPNFNITKINQPTILSKYFNIHQINIINFMIVRLPSNQFQCFMCKKSYECRESVCVHFLEHMNEPITCKRCQIVLHDFQSYLKHSMYHVAKFRRVTCVECGHVNSNLKDLKCHMKIVHKLEVSCKDCGEQFVNIKELEHHLKEHTPNKPFECNWCHQRIENRILLKPHLKEYHRPKDEGGVCSYCGKYFQTKPKLKIHERKVHENTAITCNICGKSLSSELTFKLHMRMHNNTHKLKCSVCKKGYGNKSSLKEHFNSHHNEEKKIFHTCPICQKGFLHYGSYYMHVKWHKNPYPGECKLCGYKSRYKHLIDVHVRRVHTKETFDCTYCDQKYYTEVQLKKHMSKHTGKYKYNCDDCKKGWNVKAHWRTHRFRVHGDPLPEKKVKTKEDYKIVIPDLPPSLPGRTCIFGKDVYSDDDDGN